MEANIPRALLADVAQRPGRRAQGTVRAARGLWHAGGRAAAAAAPTRHGAATELATGESWAHHAAPAMAWHSSALRR